MAKFRGSKGAVALGGIVRGNPLVNGARPQGATTANIDGASLSGVILKGDTFTVAGHGQVYTITQDVLITGNAAAIEFTPGIVPGAGWADNAAITFTSNAVAQVRAWEATPSRPIIDATCMGDPARRVDLDEPMFTASVTALFDYGDARHAKIIDEVRQNNDIGELGLILTAAANKEFYGHAAAATAAVRAQRGAHVEVVFTFEGDGALALNW